MYTYSAHIGGPMSLEAEAYFHAKLIEHTEEYESALDQHGDNPLRCVSVFLPEYPHALDGLSIPAEGGGALIFEVDPISFLCYIISNLWF